MPARSVLIHATGGVDTCQVSINTCSRRSRCLPGQYYNTCSGRSRCLQGQYYIIHAPGGVDACQVNTIIHAPGGVDAWVKMPHLKLQKSCNNEIL